MSEGARGEFANDAANRQTGNPGLLHAGDETAGVAGSHGGARMMITMLIVFTIGGQNFERHEPMPTLATCWERAPERMNALLRAHPEMTKLAVGCVINNGDPI